MINPFAWFRSSFQKARVRNRDFRSSNCARDLQAMSLEILQDRTLLSGDSGQVVIAGGLAEFTEVESNDTLATANVVDANVLVMGTISSTDDRDVFAITVTENVLLKAHVETTAALDVRISLLDDRGKLLLTSDSDQFSGQLASIQQHLSVGAYFLAVNGNGVDVGEYSVRIQSQAAALSIDHIPIAATSFGPRIGDYNGDGHLDVVGRQFFAGIGDGTFAPTSTDAGSEIAPLLEGDFNDDGHIDFARGSGGFGRAAVITYLGNGEGSFQAVSTTAPSGNQIVDGYQTGDFNEDGKLDIVNATLFEGLYVLLSVGDGTFESRSIGLEDREIIVQMLVVDLNNDLHLDLVLLGGIRVNGKTLPVAVLLGRGDGTFADPIRPDEVVLIGNVAAGDFNGDGLVDLASGVGAILLNQGDGVLTMTPYRGPSRFETIRDLLVADFDNDGSADLVEVGETGLTVFTGVGQGGFSTSRRIETGGIIREIVTVDVNHDHNIDLAFLPSNGSNDVTVILGKGDGDFDPAQRFPAELSPMFLRTGDFNSDGVLDLLTIGSTNSSSRMGVLLGIGDGSFLTRRRFAENTIGRSLVSDLNSDGLPDVLRMHINEENVISPTALIGGGNGTFSVAPQPPVGEFVSGISLIADVNGDGRPDALGTSIRGVGAYFGIGDGTFDVFHDLYTEAGSSAGGPLFAADFNKDGLLDLVTTSFVLIQQGNGTFQGSEFTGGNNVGSYIVEDLNNDGALDLATVRGSTVNVYWGRGDGTFTTGIFEIAIDGSVLLGGGLKLVAANVNGDDRLDLAVLHIAGNGSDTSAVTVLLGIEDSHFEILAPIILGDGLRVRSMQSGDFNNDGHDELVVAIELTSVIENGFRRLRDGNLTVLSFDEEGLLSSRLELPSIGSTEVFVVDHDLDGDSDLMSTGSETAVFLGLGDGTFAQGSRFDETTAQRPAIADFNRDGRPDLVSGFNEMLVLLGQPLSVNEDSGVVTGRAFLNAADLPATAVESIPFLVDVDGDGNVDSLIVDKKGRILIRQGRSTSAQEFDAPIQVNLTAQSAQAITPVDQTIAAINSDNSISIYSLLPNRTFSETAKLATGATPIRIAATDLNQDDREDVVVINAGSGDISIFLAQPDGTFAAQPRIAVGVVPSALLLTDVDRDGVVDVLVANGVSGDVCILLNQGDATFQATRYRAGNGFYTLDSDSSGKYVRSREQTSAIVAGDFDEDGRTDVIVANPGEHGFLLLRGSSQDGLLNPNRNDFVLTKDRPVLLRSADFNGDEHLDLLLINEEASEVVIYLGNGLGRFALHSRVSTGNRATGLTVVDVTGPEAQPDDVLDLLVGNEFGDVLTLQGNGDGTFSLPTRIERNVPLAVSDLDGDGKLDYVLANQSRDRVVVHASTTGRYQPPQSTDRPVLGPGAVKLEDLNRDGLADLIVANTGNNNVLVYRGEGQGQFAPPDTYFTGTHPVGLTIEDVTGDDRPDLIVANQGSNDVSILKWQADSSGGWVSFGLGPRLDLGTGAGPVSTTLMDHDNDGIADLLVTNSQSGTLALLPGRGNGFFDDQTQNTFDIGPTSTQGGTVVGDQFFAVNPVLDVVTFIPSLSAFFRASDPLSFVFSFDTGGEGPSSLLPFDLNGDSHLDLLVANTEDGSVSLMLGDGEGFSLDQLLRDPSLAHPSALALARVDDRVEIYVTDQGEEIATIIDLVMSERPGPNPDPDTSTGTPLDVASSGLLPTQPFGLALIVAVLLPGSGIESLGLGDTDQQAELSDLLGELINSTDESQRYQALLRLWRFVSQDGLSGLTETMISSTTRTLLTELGVDATTPEVSDRIQTFARAVTRANWYQTTWLRAIDEAAGLLKQLIPSGENGTHSNSNTQGASQDAAKSSNEAETSSLNQPQEAQPLGNDSTQQAVTAIFGGEEMNALLGELDSLEQDGSDKHSEASDFSNAGSPSWLLPVVARLVSGESVRSTDRRPTLRAKGRVRCGRQCV